MCVLWVNSVHVCLVLRCSNGQTHNCVPVSLLRLLPSFLLIFTHCSAFSTSSPVPPSPLPCSSLFVHPPFFVSSILRLASYHPPSSSSASSTLPPLLLLPVWGQSLITEQLMFFFVLEETWIQSFQLSLNTTFFTWIKTFRVKLKDYSVTPSVMHVMDIQFSSLYLDSLLWSGRSTERILSGLVVFTSSPKYDHYIFLSSPTHSFSPESVCSLFTRLRNIYSLLCSLCRLVAQTLTQNGGQFLKWLGKKKNTNCFFSLF